MAASQPSSTRHTAANDETRTRLLQAASEVFADRGYHYATVREICNRANVNLALVNYHFGDKLELYTEVLRSAVKHPGGLHEVHDLFTHADEPETILRKFIHVMLHRMVKRREGSNLHMRLMLHELARPTPAVARVVDESIKPLHDRLRGLLGEIMGLPPEHDKTRLCTQSIIGQTIHYAHHSPVIARLWPELKMTSEQQDMVADHIADFSLAYLKLTPKKHSLRKAVKSKQRGKR
ncbi:MAG TPA: CerR family C-terminal domain-containing protein [Bryobacteraceae bacterium]|jgi:AcrR family transcriptional regulator|nr:CerR family C-terminal domain-containing protein [Bryobacteraceae bacterium]